MTRVLRIVAILSLAFAACREEETATAPKIVAQLVQTEGKVSLQRGEAPPLPARPGPLAVGDLVTTGEGATAVLRFSDGQELEIAPNTRFRLEEKLDQVSLDMEQGEIVTRATPEGTGPSVQVSIRMPEGIASVHRGSEASFSVKGGGSAIDVRLGEVTLVDKDGVERRAGAGERLQVNLGRIELVPKATKPKETEPAAGESIPLTLVAERGVVLLTPAGGKLTKVTKKPVAVGTGAEFFVPKLARAVLSGGSLQAVLTDGAKGAVGAAKRADSTDRYVIALRAGTTRLLFGGNRSVNLALGGGRGEARLAAAEAGTVVATATPGGLHMEVLAGSVDLSAAGPAQNAKACAAADLDDHGVHVSPCPRPALSLPAAHRVRVVANRLREVALAVPEGSDKGVPVVAANDSALADRLLAGRVYSAYTLVEPPARGEIFWRVGAEGETEQRGQARFEPDDARGGDSENPHAEVADTGLKASVYFQSKLPSLTFTFPPTDGAKSYRLRVYRTEDVKTPVVDATTAETRYAVPSGKIGEGSFVWYASPLDEAGTELAGGRMNKLEVSYDNSYTTLAIEHPRPGEHAAPTGVRAEGTAPLGARLFVNGRAAPLDAKGRFALTLPRTELVIFRLVAQNGGESYWVRQLKAGR